MEAKNFMASKTFQGLIVMILTLALPKFGLSLGDDETQQLAVIVIQALAGLWIAVGRVTASKSVTLGSAKVGKGSGLAGLCLLILAYGFACGVLTGCAGTNTTTDLTANSYKTLALTGVAYDSAMKSAAIAYEHGQISEAQKAEITRYGNAFAGAYHLAVVALEQSAQYGASNATTGTKVAQALADVASRFAELKAYAEPLVGAISGKKE